MPVALLKKNEAAGKWEASYNGRVLASSPDRDYVKRVIDGCFSKKARALGITSCEEIGEQTSGFGALDGAAPLQNTPTVEKEFPINERFAIMQDYVEMVAKGELVSAVVTGEGGIGKTFTVMKSLTAAGLEDVSKIEAPSREQDEAEIDELDLDDLERSNSKGYVVVKGYSTAKGLFRTLYENRRQNIVFDDCDNILRDPTAVNILKAALDSYDTRIVSWNAEMSFGGDDDLPKQFEFKGGVIFISNMPRSKIPQAIRSRAMCADVSMTRAEVIERMHVIVQSDEFLPEFEMALKLEALEFVASHVNNPMIQALNLRSLVNTVKMRAAQPDRWKRLSLYDMANS